MAHGNLFTIATHAAHRRHQEMVRDEPYHIKVMHRMDRRLRKHGVRSYRGYATKGKYYARLNFDDGHILMGIFGEMFWIHGMHI